jgi:hypothetical protein
MLIFVVSQGYTSILARNQRLHPQQKRMHRVQFRLIKLKVIFDIALGPSA